MIGKLLLFINQDYILEVQNNDGFGSVTTECKFSLRTKNINNNLIPIQPSDNLTELGSITAAEENNP